MFKTKQRYKQIKKKTSIFPKQFLKNIMKTVHFHEKRVPKKLGNND